MLFALGCLVMASCSDDTTNDISVHGLTVLSAKTSFSAVGGTDTVAVAKTPIKAYAKDAWATTALSGTNVTITAGFNTGKESRHTTVVIKSSEVDSTIIDVDQAGAFLNINAPANVVSDDNSKTLSYPAASTMPITVSADSSWITPSVDARNINVELGANNNGHIRSGHVFIAAGNYKDTITVHQGEFAKDIAGTYALIDTYRSTKDNPIYQLAILKEENGQKIFDFSSLNLKLPITWSDKDMSISVNAGTLMGQTKEDNTISYVYNLLWDINEGYLTWSTVVSYTASLNYNAQYDLTYGDFKDNGSWPGYTIGALRFELFSSTPASSDGRLNKAIAYIVSPELQKISSSTSAAASAQNISAKVKRISTYISRK